MLFILACIVASTLLLLVLFFFYCASSYAPTGIGYLSMIVHLVGSMVFAVLLAIFSLLIIWGHFHGWML